MELLSGGKICPQSKLLALLTPSSSIAGELYKHLKKYGRFTQPMVKFYSAEIALAIEYLHKKSLVYRDLKPENVVIDRGGHAIMTDFGLAKHIDYGSDQRWSKYLLAHICESLMPLLCPAGHTAFVEHRNILVQKSSIMRAIAIPPIGGLLGSSSMKCSVVIPLSRPKTRIPPTS